MTRSLDILAALDGAEVLSNDGSPVSDDASTLLGRMPSPVENWSAGERRAEGGEAPAAVSATPRDMGYSVEAMNRRHALVRVGSKVMVLDENPDAPIEQRLTLLTAEAFHAWYANTATEICTADGTVKSTTWSARWWKDRQRRQYKGLCFFPNPDGAPSPEGFFNLWKGYSVAARKGGSWGIFRDHLLTNVCGGDEGLFRWVFAFFAHMMQRPRERIGVALVMRGKMGTGKTLPVEVFGSLIASHFFLVDDPRYVTGNFNAHMASCVLLGAEEAVWAGDKAAEGRLKGLITSTFQMIENKGVDPIRLDNYVRLVMTSNEGWVVPAGKDERRFCVTDVSDRCKENHEYFAELLAELDDGGREALLHDLLDFDLSTVNLRTIPKTDALLEQKIRSFSSVEAWWFERLKEGSTRVKSGYWEQEVDRQALFADYLEKSDKVGIKRRAIETEVGMEMKKLVPTLKEARPTKMTERGSERVRVYVLPDLDECRMWFESAVGQEVDWGDGPAEKNRVEGEDDGPSNL
mgnify:FL=1